MGSQDFEIIGWELDDVAGSAERALSAMRECSADVPEFCIEAHFRDLEALKQSAQIVPSNRYACYCWCPQSTPADLDRAEFARVRNARFLFDHTTIAIEEAEMLPAYDWTGRPGEWVTLRLIRKHSKPLSEAEKQPSAVTASLCFEVASSLLGGPLPEPVNTVTEWTDDGRAHHYLFSVPRAKAALIVRELSLRLGLSIGLASFEFLGTADHIEQIRRSGNYNFERFPANCWSFNQPGGSAFALERAGFIAPILNVNASQLGDAAARLKSLGARITRCSFARRYIAWKLDDGCTTPRAGGNYLLLSRLKTGCAIFIGCEQYSDSDPPVARFSASTSERLGRLGAKLKKVSTVR